MMKSIKEKLEQGRAYRSIQMDNIEVNDEMVVEGYATTFDTPYLLYQDEDINVFEQVDKRAFDECDMSDVIMQYDHQGRVFARTSNKSLQLEVDDNGLKVRANLGGTEIGRQLYEEIKGGFTSKMSFGFVVEEDEIDGNDEVKKYTRTIKKIRKLYDVSAVSLPANDTTEISARSDANGVIDIVNKEIEEKRSRERQKQRIRIMTELRKEF